MSKDDNDSRDPPDDDRPRVTPEVLREFLSRLDVHKSVIGSVAKKVSEYYREAVAQDCLEEALAAKSLPYAHKDPVAQDKGMQAWLGTLVDRKVADHHEWLRTRKEHEGEMPTAPVKRDEAGEPIEGDDEAVTDIDPSHDPRAEDRRMEGILLKQFLEHAVRGNPRDEETCSWVFAWTDEDKSYEQIAKDAKLTTAAVYSRVHEFKNKYLPRYKRFRNRAILLILLFAAAVAWVIYTLWPRTEPIQPARDFKWPVPSASASAGPPPDDSFNNALPTPPPQPPPQPLKP